MLCISACSLQPTLFMDALHNKLRFKIEAACTGVMFGSDMSNARGIDVQYVSCRGLLSLHIVPQPD
jgi:hypothetical protein